MIPQYIWSRLSYRQMIISAHANWTPITCRANTDKQAFALTFSPKDKSESSINRKNVLERGRKQKYPCRENPQENRGQIQTPKHKTMKVDFLIHCASHGESKSIYL